MTDPRPFFVTTGGAPRGARRLLLISYHFPPSETAGALRWRRLAALASQRGWCLDVVTLDPSSLSPVSRDGLTDLPDGTRLFGVPLPLLRRQRVIAAILDTYRRLAAGRGRRGQDRGLDPVASGARTDIAVRRPGVLSRAYGAHLDNAVHGRWSRRAAALGSQLAARNRYHAIITCGPPHMAHIAGRAVARRHGLPLIVDLRDPWRLVERLADSIDSPVWRWHAAWHERRVIPGADLVVMNTEPARDAMRARYPAASSRVIAVMNGFDEEDVPRTVRPAKFIVAYSGSIYLDRDPRSLFEAARHLIQHRRLTPNDFGITLIGNVHECRGAPTTAIARAAQIEPYVELLPHSPRHELLTVLARSAMLVSLPQDSYMAIPSKLFEYMQFDAWILALAEPHSATARLLAGSRADVLSAGDITGIAAVLERRCDQYRRGEYPERLATEDRFSRREQATLLFDALERCTTSPSSNGGA